ncbi:MAG: ComF family protein [Acetobacteraceae bacterium]|nr:ComF family protein [Acetobacteraceae bacterium]
MASARSRGPVPDRSSRLIGGLLDLLLPVPPGCLICGRSPLHDEPSRRLCAACLSSLLDFPPYSCARCGRPLPPPLPDAGPGWNRGCPDCARFQHLGRVRAVGVYTGALRAAIHMLKYGGRLELAPMLGRLLARMVGACLPEAQALVPVPLHPGRLRQRGYNQAELLAREAARLLGLWAGPTGLVRLRPTRPQAGLDAGERALNLAGAFGVGRAGELVGRRVVLVDDVMTTGATLEECAACLLRAGAAQVDAAVLAVASGMSA